MPLQIKVSARAANEIRRAAQWWAANRLAAPGAIGADLSETIKLLAEQPGIGSKYEGKRVQGARRLFLGRVGYFIYYVADDKDLKVLAFWHASRLKQPAL